MSISGLLPLEEILDPPNRPCVRLRDTRANRHVPVGLVAKLGSPAEQPDRGRIRRAADLVTHANRLIRRSDPRRQVEQRLCGLGETEEAAAATGEHDPSREEPIVSAPTHFQTNHLEDFAGPGRNDLGQVPAGKDLPPLPPDLAVPNPPLAGYPRRDLGPADHHQQLPPPQGGT